MAVELGEVALDVERPATGRLDFGPHGIVGFGRQEVGVGDVAAGPREHDRNGLADALPASGDQRDGAAFER